MKKILLSLLTFVFLAGTFTLNAQEEKAEKRIEKQIQIEEEDGEITVTLTEKDGKTMTKKVMTGEEAEAYLEGHDGTGSFSFSGEEGVEKVIIMEKVGDETESFSWVSDVDIDMNGLTDDLEELRDELDNLSIEEIAARLDEMIEMREEMKELHVIKMIEMHENMDSMHEMVETMDVQVEEKDGVITIIKRNGDEEIVEEIIIDEKNGEKKIIVMASSSSEGDKVIEYKMKGSSDNMNLNVFPNPSDGNFTIELDLKKGEEADVRVMDSSGKVVYKVKVSGIEKHNLKVKLKKPSAGAYVIVVEQGGKILKLKTIIE